MKKALEIRPVLAPGPDISDAILQIAKNPFGMQERLLFKDYSYKLVNKQMPQDATCRDSCGTFASIAGLSNMQTPINQQTKIGAGNGRERLAL